MRYCNWGWNMGGWYSIWNCLFSWPFILFTLMVLGGGALLYWHARRQRLGDAGQSPACPHCGGSIHYAFLRCPSCGGVLKRHCPQCARIVEHDWKYCPACRAELVAAAQEGSGPTAASSGERPAESGGRA
ncbi:MAG TPA: hypothetical protein ENJ73_02910 [Desulfobacterales bacterium]|nr:hypothetical protein [Desulfobacterales bacterium]